MNGLLQRGLGPTFFIMPQVFGDQFDKWITLPKSKSSDSGRIQKPLHHRCAPRKLMPFLLGGIMAAITGCSKTPKAPQPEQAAAPQPEKIEDVEPKIPEGVKGHVLHLMLSNQSAETDPIDFRVLIDQQQVWSGKAALRGGHNVLEKDIKLAEGNHVLVVETKNGKAEIRRDIRIDGPLYVDVAYWHHPGRPSAMSPKFSIRMEVTPFYPQ